MNVLAQAGSVTLTGMVIVFGVLAIIYIALKVMELALGNRVRVVVSSPCAGTVESIVAARDVKKDDAVVVLLSGGARGEIPSPAEGRLETAVKAGDAVKTGDKLFEIREAK